MAQLYRDLTLDRGYQWALSMSTKIDRPNSEIGTSGEITGISPVIPEYPVRSVGKHAVATCLNLVSRCLKHIKERHIDLRHQHEMWSLLNLITVYQSVVHHIGAP